MSPYLPSIVGGNSGAYEELKLATGTIVDATIINAPSSTENANEARNREMQQTKKRATRGYSPRLGGQRDWAAPRFRCDTKRRTVRSALEADL
jgi:hypothetical protein